MIGNSKFNLQFITLSSVRLFFLYLYKANVRTVGSDSLLHVGRLPDVLLGLVQLRPDGVHDLRLARLLRRDPRLGSLQEALKAGNLGLARRAIKLLRRRRREFVLLSGHHRQAPPDRGGGG